MLDKNNFYLVGIKGVAMTSLAQCLVDAGKSVTGSDVAEEFVTQPILDKLNLTIDTGFDTDIPAETDCLIYTSAHQGPSNPQVLSAQAKSVLTLSHAEALAELFNAKLGVAVSGVGGKSTTSAMIAWILEKNNFKPSFSVGVGDIPGLGKTGQWLDESKVFVAEADEYVTDPAAPSKGEEITPRFSFLRPHVTVCTNLKFDHPDVYTDFNHTKQVYKDFFRQIDNDGTLIINQDDSQLVNLVNDLNVKKISFGQSEGSTFHLTNFHSSAGKTIGEFSTNNKQYKVELNLPGRFNILNGLAALAACQELGVNIEDGLTALSSFNSTLRRSQFIGEKNGIKYYDDYAHHPHEIGHVIQAFKEWFPDQRLVVAFQPHTYSRTKKLQAEFVKVLATSPDLVLLDIFASAREQQDDTISSDMLVEQIKNNDQVKFVENLKTVDNLANFCLSELKEGDVMLTLGAGDIYKVHEKI